METVLLSIISALGAAAFRYLLGEQKELKKRVKALEHTLGVRERAYSRLRQSYVRQREENVQLRQRLQVMDGLKLLDQRYPPERGRA